MTKYLIAILIFIAALAGVMLWVGDDAMLQISSTATSGTLAFAPIEMTWQFAILVGTVGVLSLIGLWSLFLWLWRLPRRVRSGVGLRRRNRAIDAMEGALVAGAEGNVAKSRKQAERARGLVGSTDLGRIISAQAAEAAGDKDEAISHYTAMLDSDKTRSTGQRGLAQNLLATGDVAGAIEHARLAYTENKEARWAFDTLFKAEVADYRWQDAIKTLDMGVSRKHIDGEVARRRRAVLLAAAADQLHDAQADAEALPLAAKAGAVAPEFAPAVALAAKLYGRTGETKKAYKLMESSWSVAPHPAMALAMLDLLAPDDKKTRDKRLKSLIAANPAHRESKLLEVEEYLRADDAVQAWATLRPVLRAEGEPSSRLCVLAAQAEERLNNPTDAAVWMQRAVTAPREADWSDLDPTGDSFDYTPQDWRRLVFSFGDSGELIHPRAEAQSAARLPGLPVTVPVQEVEGVQTISETKAQAQAQAEADVATPDLAKRLDSLLDKS